MPVDIGLGQVFDEGHANGFCRAKEEDAGAGWEWGEPQEYVDLQACKERMAVIRHHGREKASEGARFHCTGAVLSGRVRGCKRGVYE